MSGVYIPGMEMPKNCASCGVACRHYLEHGLDGMLSRILRTESRLPNCPLVPVADHGDLIDRDVVREMIDVIWTAYVLTEYEEIFEICDGEIMAAPVIIPADTEKEVEG